MDLLSRWLQMRGRHEVASSLRPLSPRFEQDEHGYYAAALVAQLVRVGPDAPRNIALTGHYGSGKSSILLEVQRRLNTRRRFLRRQRGKAVNVSLSSLGTDEPPEGRLGDDGAPPALTNLIQKEIVKQLLYRARPRRMRGSRFRRLDVFHPVSVAAWSLMLALGVAAVALLFGLLDRVSRALPAQWVAEGPWVPWAAVGAMALIGAALGWSAARALHNRVRIGDASAGLVKVSLKDETPSFFDAYLDELVYFFQASRTSVVIFEDLDRFNYPQIFESLRELNTVLSNAEQIRYRPMRFVYAIKDSIFETITDADDDKPPAQPEAAQSVPTGTTTRSARQAPEAVVEPAPAPSSPADAHEGARREATRNRTKFFDLVVPIVPFISHRNARELVRFEFKGTGVDEALLDLIAPYLTDMRLLHNIRNEYDVFAAQILPPQGPDGLGRNQMLAMIVYKNLHLTDFEAIRENESVLDDLYRMYRDLVTTTALDAEQDADHARSALNRLEGGPARAHELGARLRTIADIASSPSGPSAGVKIGSTSYEPEKFNTMEFWRAWAQSGAPLTLLDQYGNATKKVAPASAQSLFDIALDPAHWDAQQKSHLERQVRTSSARARTIERASLQQVLADDSLVLVRKNEPDVPLITLAEDMLDDLTLALVTGGYLLDENYTLYVARFHVGKLSLRAMNFILHSVQPNRRDLRFQFHDSKDIDAVIEEEGARFLNGEAVFNLEVFDHLLATAPERLSTALARLTDGSAESTQFLDTFLTHDGHSEALIRLLAPQWPAVFTHLSADGRLRPDLAVSLSDAAVQAAVATTSYDVSTAARSTIQTLTRHGAAFVTEDAPRSLDALVDILRKFEVDVADLRPLAQDVREAVVLRSMYPVTATNLRAAIGQECIDLGALYREDKIVYGHVREHLQTYVDEVIPEGGHPLEADGPWRDVLTDLTAHPQAAVQAVLERSASDVRAESLDEFDESTWPVLARTGRFAATASNLARYVEALGTNESLATYLTRVNDQVELDLIEPETTVLALALINSAMLPAQRSTALARALKPAPLAFEDLSVEAAPTVPGLVAAGLLPDDAAAYRFLRDHPWPLRAELVAASSAFAGYLTELDLDRDEFRALANDERLPVPARQALVDNLAQFSDCLDARSATALTRWVRGRRRTARPGSVVLLARGGADPADVLAVLAPRLGALNWTEIAPVLQALGAPYDGLLVTGDSRWLTLPASDGLRKLLHRLKDLGRVTSHDEHPRRGEFVVRRKVNPAEVAAP